MPIRVCLLLSTVCVSAMLFAGTASGAPRHRHRAHRSARSVARHVPTWAYDDGCVGGKGASARLVRAWVTYAESNCGPENPKVLADCHADGVRYCQAIAYVQPSIIYADSPLARLTIPESWYLHQPGYADAAHRLRTSAYGGGYYLDQANPDADAFFATSVKTSFNDYDGLMVDDTGASLQSQFFGTGLDTSQEISSGDQLLAAHEEMASELMHLDGNPFLEVDNGIGANPWLSMPFPLLGHPEPVSGLIAEDVPEDNGLLINSAWAYPTMLDEMAYVGHTAADFMVLLSYNRDGARSSRRMQAATVLLGYSRAHIVSWSDLEQHNRDLAVWPEEGIVPTRPRQTMRTPRGRGCLQGTGNVCSRGGHNNVQVAPGVYRREFARCYYRGVRFGRCAVIVNTTDRALSVKRRWLTRAYGHRITFVGGDVQSGGRLKLRGARFHIGHTRVPAEDALLLSR
jgi:hypothetical protein